jgi:hypothetical protein
MGWQENGGSCTVRNFIFCAHTKTSSATLIHGKWAEHVAQKILRFAEKPEGKRSLGRPSRRWDGRMKMYLRQTG